MNIGVRLSAQEAVSVLHNPCATVVTERPLDRGDVMEVVVEPDSLDSHSVLKVFLTHKKPPDLKLQNPRVYFSEKKVLDR